MRGLSLVAASGFLRVVASLAVEHGFEGAQSSVVAAAGSVVEAHRPSCPMACGIFVDQGLNPCALHFKADS